MRNRKEIIEYLGLEMSEEHVGKEGVAENERYIKAAEKIEREFTREIANGTFGYGLHSDFVSRPSAIDDGELEEVVNYNGVVLYRKL